MPSSVADEDDGYLLRFPNAEGFEIAVNRATMTRKIRKLEVFDVIAVEDHRIELLGPRPQHRALRCDNPVCKLLNPYDLHGFCRYCSVKLVNANSVTVT